MGGRATVRRKLCNLPPSDTGQSVTDYEPMSKMIGTRHLCTTLLTDIFSGTVQIRSHGVVAVLRLRKSSYYKPQVLNIPIPNRYNVRQPEPS